MINRCRLNIRQESASCGEPKGVIEIELQYIYHSGFALLAEEFTMIMDYYQDICEAPGFAVRPMSAADLLTRPGKIYILSSHSHHDHYNPVIFKWRQKRADIIYILSDDIHAPAGIENLHYLHKGQTYEDDLTTITAYGSTDEGISFSVHAKKEQKSLFHAGDLNNWHWNEEVPAAEAAGYEDAFLKEVEEIRRDHPAFDVVLFPVDPRLGRDYMKGPLQFLERIKTGILVPMHFGLHYDKAAQIEKKAAPLGVRCIQLQHKGDLIYV